MLWNIGTELFFQQAEFLAHRRNLRTILLPWVGRLLDLLDAALDLRIDAAKCCGCARCCGHLSQP